MGYFLGRFVKTQVLSIENIEQESDSKAGRLDGLKVSVGLGEITKQFIFTVKKAQIADRTLITFVENADFSKTFQFNDAIAMEITNLVKQVYRGESIVFPVTVSDFGTPEQALAQQKSFNKEVAQKM